MATQIIGDVQNVAKYVIDVNHPYYLPVLLKLLPKQLLEKKLTDGNLEDTVSEIDKLRFQKEKELLGSLGVTSISDSDIKAKEASGELSLAQRRLRREIMFLFNVAATVAHA